MSLCHAVCAASVENAFAWLYACVRGLGRVRMRVNAACVASEGHDWW